MPDNKVIDAIEEVESDLVTLSTGVVLKAKKANPLMMIKVMAAHPRPKPPLWKHPTMGREMENPDDPEYQAQLKAYEMETNDATLNAFILLGTELVSVPKGMEKPHPKGDKPLKWIDDYSLLNIPMFVNNASWRYLTWVMFKAIADEKDLTLIQEAVGRLSGISEKSVESAESFSGSK